jgi:serine/threonine protein kinase
MQVNGIPVKLAIKEFIAPPNIETLQKDVEEIWNSEADTLNQISNLSHNHLIQRIAAISRGNQRFLMFRWAEGGNLRDFWKDNPKPPLTPTLVKDVFVQLRGMAEALQRLHEYSDQIHYRHGDIKPENILIFPNDNGRGIGTFKISDMGSAKSHNVVTRLRQMTGGKAFATLAYQAPEAVTNIDGASSRLYDIWSMGCVTLEFMVWLLYGYQELECLCRNLARELGQPSCFFKVKYTDSGCVAHIHYVVTTYLDRMSNDPACAANSALGQLLSIIKSHLLVIELPLHTQSSLGATNVSVTAPALPPRSHKVQLFGKHRTNAKTFVNELDLILNDEKAINENYWLTEANRDHVPTFGILPASGIDETPSPQFLSPAWRPGFPDRTKMQSPSNEPRSLIQVPNLSHNVSTLEQSNNN